MKLMKFLLRYFPPGMPTERHEFLRKLTRVANTSKTMYLSLMYLSSFYRSRLGVYSRWRYQDENDRSSGLICRVIKFFNIKLLFLYLELEFDTFILSSRVYNRNATSSLSHKIFSANVSYN